MITVKYGPRKTSISGTTEEIDSLLRNAKLGASINAREYPNGHTLNAFFLTKKEQYEKALEALGDADLEYQQGRGM